MPTEPGAWRMQKCCFPGGWGKAPLGAKKILRIESRVGTVYPSASGVR